MFSPVPLFICIPPVISVCTLCISPADSTPSTGRCARISCAEILMFQILWISSMPIANFSTERSNHLIVLQNRSGDHHSGSCCKIFELNLTSTKKCICGLSIRVFVSVNVKLQVERVGHQRNRHHYGSWNGTKHRSRSVFERRQLGGALKIY